MSSVILIAYLTHHLLCLRDPFAYYKLSRDKDISIINMGTSATQALQVAFAGIKTFIEESEFFKIFSPDIKQGNIRFEKQGLTLISGNSKSTTPLGYNVFCAILDEAAFFLDNEHKSVAEDIYNSLQRRIVSRFGYNGLLVMISSPRYEGDFIMQKLSEARLSDKVYGIQLPTWKVKRRDSLDLVNKFYYSPSKGIVQTEKPDYTDNIDLIEDTQFNTNAEWWEIPGEFRKSFDLNPEKAKRDFGATPSKSLEGFFPLPDIVAGAFNPNRQDPVQPDGRLVLDTEPLRTEYFIHIDLALNKQTGNNESGGGDFAAMAMAHFNDWEINDITGERKKKVYVDFVWRIGADPHTKEVDFEKIRQTIYALKDRGYNITLVSLDSYQSADTAQLLRKKGIKSELLSVDRTIEPYNTLKELIYDRRIDIHPHTKLQEELCGLEVIKGNKIDHPKGSSKDCADALCGAVYNVITHTKNTDYGVLVSGTGITPLTEEQERQKIVNDMKLQKMKILDELARQGRI